MIEFLRLKWLNWTKGVYSWLNKVSFKQAEAAVCNIRRKTPVLECLFNKVADCNYIKKRLQFRSFPINMAKFLRPAFFIEHLRSLILNTHSFCMILPQFAL